MNSSNQEPTIQASVKEAYEEKSALRIIAGNSKSFYGRQIQQQPLDVSIHHGIVNYHPSELVVTARSGTSLTELQTLLAEQGQMLAFEPPHFSETATLGGTIACGFSGPRRPFTGSARDFMLGCKILTGRGEILSFGGEVMKNVAGYDVSRLMVGALGTLGILLEISLKVLPLPECETTIFFQLEEQQAIETMADLQLQGRLISGLCFDEGILYVRLSGSEKAVISEINNLGGEKLKNSKAFWQNLREQQLEFFQTQKKLWRISVPPAAPIVNVDGEWFYDWGGALRWLKTNCDDAEVFDMAQQTNGHAVLFRNSGIAEDIFQPLSAGVRLIHQNLKRAFDPANILNPNKMYSDW